MAMSKRLFRTKQAIESFEKCLQCTSLPENKIGEVKNELEKSKSRLQKQEDDVSTCTIQKCVSLLCSLSLHETVRTRSDVRFTFNIISRPLQLISAIACPRKSRSSERRLRKTIAEILSDNENESELFAALSNFHKSSPD